MSPELIGIITVGVALAGLILNGQREVSKLRDDVASLRERMARLEGDIANLRERMAHLESLLAIFAGQRGHVVQVEEG